MGTRGVGAEMKAIEAGVGTVLARRALHVLRVDGRAFHTYTRGLERPFDAQLAADLDAAAVALCEEVAGALLAYVQSDEISVLFSDLGGANSAPWFGGRVQKIASVAASLVTAAFNARRARSERLACFDARVLSLPGPEHAAAYFGWRQADAVRNSISMAARAHFSAKQLHGVSSDEARARLRDEAGIEWTDYPAGFRYGRVIQKRQQLETVTFRHRRTQELASVEVLRSRWEVAEAPAFDQSETIVDLLAALYERPAA